MVDINDDVLAQRIDEAEDCVLHMYFDTKGMATIGYGRMIDSRLGGGITKDEALFLLKNDIKRIKQEASTLSFYPSLNLRRKYAILDMLYNLGLPKFLKFKKMIAALEVGDYDRAAEEALDSKWRHDVGDRALRIARDLKHG